MAVSSGTRLASLPVIGWVYLHLVRLRSKAAAARPEQVAHIASPALAGLMAVGVVLIPFVQSDSPTTVRANGPTAIEVTVATAFDANDPAAVAAAPTDSAPVAAPAATSVPSARTSTRAADATVAGVDVYTTPEGQQQAREHAQEMPIYTPLGSTGFLGVDPAQLVLNALEPLVPTAPGAQP
jgi:hypothetical protein